MAFSPKLLALAVAAAFAATAAQAQVVVKIGHVGPTTGGIAHHRGSPRTSG